MEPRQRDRRCPRVIDQETETRSGEALTTDPQPGVWVQHLRAAVAPGSSELCTPRFQMLTARKESQRLALAAAWGLQDLALVLSTGRGTCGESQPLSGLGFLICKMDGDI